MPLSSPSERPTPRPSTLSLHDALPILIVWPGSLPGLRAGTKPAPSWRARAAPRMKPRASAATTKLTVTDDTKSVRSEEHTSELQSQFQLVCRLLLEKKNGGAGPTKSTG